MDKRYVYLVRNGAGEYFGKGGWFAKWHDSIKRPAPFSTKAGASAARNRKIKARVPCDIVRFELVESPEE